eukprot:scaffold11868_cov111-Skeletonema_dohrnii-CCMP3373.AAC.1
MQEQQQFQQQQTFPFKLYSMLEYACDSEFSSCISWTADGSAFIIHDKEVMMDNLAPMFFNQTKFRSFTRQLNIWGFVRTVTIDGWRHNHFLRGRPHLLNEIERIPVKSTAKAEALAQQVLNAAGSAKNVAVAAKHNPFNPQMRMIMLISALQRQRQRLSHNFHSHKLLLKAK